MQSLRRFGHLQLSLTTKTLNQPISNIPGLSRLDVSLPFLGYDAPESLRWWKHLKNTLLLLRQLQHLSLDVHTDHYVRPLPEGLTADTDQHSQSHDHDQQAAATTIRTTNKVWLPLEAGDRLPSLLSLEIRTPLYDLSAEHCRLLDQCMDWTYLKRLKIVPENVFDFSAHFRGKLPAVQDFEMTYQATRQSWNGFAHCGRDFELKASELVTDLVSLTHLIVRCDSFSPWKIFWHQLALTHGGTLKSLSIQPSTRSGTPYLDEGELKSYLSRFSALTHLQLAMRGCYFCGDRVCWLDRHQSVSITIMEKIARLTATRASTIQMTYL